MSRSDGEFPKYQRLEIDENEWPVDYWESHRRCSSCGAKWPDTVAFAVSPCCGNPTTRDSGPPDLRWDKAISALKHREFEKFYEEWNEGVSDEQLDWIELMTNGNLDPKKVRKAVNDFIKDARKAPVVDKRS